jgi:hypothetical protein
MVEQIEKKPYKNERYEQIIAAPELAGRSSPRISPLAVVCSFPLFAVPFISRTRWPPEYALGPGSLDSDATAGDGLEV